MSLHDDSDLDWHSVEWHGGWLGAAVVFAAGLAAALLVAGITWSADAEGDALSLGIANTRTLVMLPLPLR